jgi:D-alanine-D-alanine ligase
MSNLQSFSDDDLGGAHGPNRVVLLYGGRSSEHAISCVSAAAVLRALDHQRWDVLAVGITPAGQWLLTSADPDQIAPAGVSLPSVQSGEPVVLMPGDDGAHLFKVGEHLSQDLGLVDVVFPLLHGPWGEDGSVQGLLETMHVGFVGSGVLSSAIAMDKAAMKMALSAHGIPVGPYEVVHDGEWRLGASRVAARLEFALELPVFVKPARAGSSIGISKVNHWHELEQAMELARLHDPKVIVEQSVPGREIECGVLGAPRDQRAKASALAEIVLSPDREFYDFESKYLNDAATLVVPADLPPDSAEQIRDIAIRSFEALECEGLARVDFFLADNGSIVVNEVNTMPGFTPTSMYPRMWAEFGVQYSALIDTLLELALNRERGLR